MASKKVTLFDLEELWRTLQIREEIILNAVIYRDEAQRRFRELLKKASNKTIAEFFKKNNGS